MSGYKIIGGDGKEYGPVSDLQLRRWIGDGRADRSTMIRTEAEGETLQGSWTALGQSPAFVNCFPEESSAVSEDARSEDHVELVEDPQEIPVFAERINTAEVLVGARTTLNGNFFEIAAACFFVWGTMMILNRIPNGWIASLLLDGPAYGGLYFFLLQKRRGEVATINSAWEKVRENFWPLLTAGIIGSLAVRILLFLIVPGIYFLVAWTLAFLFIVDGKSNGLNGLERSRASITPHWFAVAGAFLIALLPLLAYHLYVQIKLCMVLFPIIQAQGFVLEKIEPIMVAELSKSIFITHLLQLATLPLASCVVVEVYERISGRNRPT